MFGETDLGRLLRSLDPQLSAEQFAFATVPEGQSLPGTVSPVGTFLEPEGLTIIAPAEQLRATGLQVSPGWAMISLRVHSSLQAVGLMAEIARALARAGISANVVSGYFHDHVFVQWSRRHDALEAIRGLSGAVMDP